MYHYKGIKRKSLDLYQRLSLFIQHTFAPLIVITSSLESKNIAGPGRPGGPRRPFGPINPSVPFCPLAVETKDNISLSPLAISLNSLSTQSLGKSGRVREFSVSALE